MQWCALVFVLGTLINSNAVISASRTERDVQNQVETGESAAEHIKKLGQIPWMARDEEAIVLIGEDGVGKTTLATFLTNSSALHAVKGSNGSFFYRNDHVNDASVPEFVRMGRHTAEPGNLPPAIYDFPGFKDNGTLTDDLSMTYFMRKLLDHARKVKFVFLIDYKSLEENSHEALLKLGRRATSIIKKMKKYREYIALVITKMPNTEPPDRDTFYVFEKNDENIKRKLMDAFKEFRSKMVRASEHSIIEFIHAFIADNDRIALFRQPDEETRFSLEHDHTPLNRYTARTLTDLLVKKVNYSESSMDDFEVSLPAASKTKINNYCNEACESLKSSLQSLNSQILDFSAKKENETEDLATRQRIAQFGHETMRNLQVALTKNFSDQLMKTLNLLEMSVPSDLLRNISREVELVETLSEVYNYTPKAEVLSALDPAKNHLEFSVRWYKRLIEYRQQLSSYETRSQYVRDHQTYLHSLEQDLIRELDGRPASPQFRYLKRVSNQTYSNQLDALCDSETSSLKLTGQFIRIKDAKKLKCWATAKSIVLLAWDTLFIDADIDKSGEEANLTLIAPTWSVVDTVLINLNGQNGTGVTGRAKDGARDDDINGARGADGKPGTSGGNFLGIGRIFNNSKNLTILANGGDGGNAQDGGYGWDGIDAEDPLLFGGNDMMMLWDNTTKFHEQCKRVWTQIGDHKSLDIFHEVKASAGFKAPGDGGDGGKGGEAGQRGTVKVLHVGEKPEFTVINEAGTPGQSGIGGYGGDKAAAEKTLTIVERVEYPPVLSSIGNLENHRQGYGSVACAVIETTHIDDVDWRGPGKRGADGRTASVAPAKILDQITPLIQYKEFIRTKLRNNVIESVLLDFLDQIENSSDINSLYKPLDFANELLGLESQFLALHDHLNFIPLVDSLFRRINEYEKLKNAQNQEKALSSDDKIMLDYLRSVIFSKKVALTKNGNQNVVINLPDYLTALTEQVKDLDEAKNKVAIDETAKSFRKSVENKIAAAKNLISEEVLPEIDALTDEMRAKVKSSLSSNIASQDSAKQAIVSSAAEKIALGKTLAMRQMLEPLRLFGAVLSFTDTPIGNAAGTAITGLHTLANNYISDPDMKPGFDRPTFETLSPMLKDTIGKIKTAYRQKEELFQTQFKIVKKITEVKQEDVVNAVPGVKYVKKMYDKIDGLGEKMVKHGKFANKGLVVDFLKNELVEYGGECRKMLKEDFKTVVGAGAQLLKKSDVILEKVEMIMKLKDLVTDEFEDIKEDKRKIEEAASAIDTAKSLVESLGYQEDMIRNFMITEIPGLKDDIVALNLTSKPNIETNLATWRVQNSLNDLKKEFRNLADDYLGNEFALAADKITAGLTFLIDVYDRIDADYDRQQLAQYIANIATGAVTFKTPEYNEVAHKLKAVTTSNLIFEKYQVAISSFKQHFFPFSHEYLNVYEFPSNVALQNATEVQGKVIEIIKRAKDRTEEEKNTIGPYNKYKRVSKHFEFFEWNSEQFINETKNLLQGRPTILNADIVESVNFDAVRFQTIEIKFEFNDTKTQQEFDNTFKSYEVNMKMVGNDYYRCGSRFYYTSGNNDLSLEYSIEQEKGKPTTQNDVYIKISSSDFFLSPYTMWEISLENTANKGSLETFIDKAFKLKLIGTAQYLKDFPVSYCNAKHDSYNVDTSLTVV